MKERKRYTKLLLASLIICCISIIGAYFVRTNGNSIEVKDFNIIDGNGHKIAATMYKPKTATKDLPAPTIATLHGSFNARESQSFMCLELAKRGFVAVTVDCDGHGDSENYKENPMDAFFLVTAEPGEKFEDITTAPTSGMAPVIDYLYGLDFVRKDQIGVTGHSLGGKTANSVYAYYKIQELMGEPQKIAAVFLVGNQQLSIDGKWQENLLYHPSGDRDPIEIPYNVHYGVSAGQYDENNYTTEVGGPWNFHKSDNARTFINELDEYNLSEDESVEVGKFYKGHVNGSKEEFLRVLYQPKEIHMLNPYTPASNKNVVEFFQTAFDAPNFIPAESQTILYEQIFSAVGIVGFFFAIYAFCRILLTNKYFGELAVASIDQVYRPSKPNTVSGKIYYWTFMVIGSVIPILWMIPLAMWIGSHAGEGFETRSLFGTVIWPQGNQLEQSFWVATAGIWTFLLFAVRFNLSIKKQGVKFSDYNQSISAKKLGKTLLLAILSVGFGYFIVFIASFFFNGYFGLLNWVIRFPNKNAFLVAVRYIPIFIFFYIANAFTQNIGRMYKERAEWKNIVLMCFINFLGLLLLWLYQYITFSIQGKVPLNSARVMQTWSFFIVQSICTIFARKLYLKTGKIYLGSFINAIVFTMISCCHTMTLNVSTWWF